MPGLCSPSLTPKRATPSLAGGYELGQAIERGGDGLLA